MYHGRLGFITVQSYIHPEELQASLGSAIFVFPSPDEAGVSFLHHLDEVRMRTA